MRTIEIRVSLADDELLDAIEAIEDLLGESERDVVQPVQELLMALEEGIAGGFARRRLRYRRERAVRPATLGL
jgi:hypothetical protein